MRRTKTIEINDETITVKELKVKEIKDMLESVNAETGISTVDLLFGDVVPSQAISMCSNVSIEHIEENYTPSDIEKIVEAVKELNPFFLNMMNKLIKVAENLPQQK